MFSSSSTTTPSGVAPEARDRALVAWPAAAAIFVFDEPLLSRLRLSAKRLVFITETLAELAEHRTVRVLLGDPVLDLEGIALASTFAPVPGYRRQAKRLDVVATYPSPWLAPPSGRDVRSRSAWIRRTTLTSRRCPELA